MLLTSGGRFGGYGFYLLKGKPVFLWNLVDLKRVRWEGPEALAPGKHTLEFDFKYDGLGAGTLAFNNMSGIGRSGTGVLKVDGKEVASQKMEHTIPLILQWDETFDIGSDTGTPVDDKDYQVPFTFTGKLNKLTLKLDRPKLSPADIKTLEQGASGTTAPASSAAVAVRRDASGGKLCPTPATGTIRITSKTIRVGRRSSSQWPAGPVQPLRPVRSPVRETKRLRSLGPLLWGNAQCRRSASGLSVRRSWSFRWRHAPQGRASSFPAPVQ